MTAPCNSVSGKERTPFLNGALRILCLATLLTGNPAVATTRPQGNSDDMWVAATNPSKLPPNVTHHTFESPSMKRPVGYCVYLPPSYSEKPDQQYPVIFHLHGAEGNEFRMLYSAEILHEGILKGKWPDMIVVFPN